MGSGNLTFCHEEAFAHYAVIIIGALHTALEMVQSNKSLLSVSEAENKLGEHHHIALQHYGKPLKLMRVLTQRKVPLSMRYIFLSYLLTICIDNYLGNHENALAATQIGIDMIKELAREESWCTSFEDIVDHVLKDRFLDESDLVTTFARLESNSIMFKSVSYARRQIRPSRLEGWRPSPRMPALFANAKEAQMYCDLFGR